MHKQLPKKYYFINKFDTNFISKQDKQTAIIYRNYDTQVDLPLVKKIKEYCKINKFRFYLSNDIKLAIRLNLDGAYIPSFNKDISHLSYSLKKGFTLIGSAHNLKEIKEKETQKVSQIFISSIFKHNQNYKGIYKFNILSSLTSKKIIALGGINKKNIKKLKLTKFFGFAGISFFE